MRFARKASMVLSIVGIVAVVAAIVIGLSAWPPVEAKASVSGDPTLLGVDPGTASPLGKPVGAEAKFAHDAVPVDDLSALTAFALLRPVKITTPVRRRGTSGGATPAAASGSGSRVHATSYNPAKAGGWRTARVSWYGPGFYGRHTASGPRLTHGMMNVAHKRLPFGTRIEFSYHGRTCVAVVNDRGPFVGGREFDLGPGTARALGFSGVGTVKYRFL